MASRAMDADQWDRYLQSLVESMCGGKLHKGVWTDARVVDALTQLWQSVVSQRHTSSRDAVGVASAASGSGDSNLNALLVGLLMALQDCSAEAWSVARDDMRADRDLQHWHHEPPQASHGEPEEPAPQHFFLEFAASGIESRCEDDPDWNVGKSVTGPALEFKLEGDETTWAAQDVWT